MNWYAQYGKLCMVARCDGQCVWCWCGFGSDKIVGGSESGVGLCMCLFALRANCLPWKLG